MIPKEAFADIAAAMGVSCAFGYALRGIVDSNKKSNSEWFTDGLSADHDRWEDDPESTCDPAEKTEDKRCSTCRHSDISVLCEPCCSCDLDGRNWEAKG